MNTKLNRIKSALRESIEIASKATEEPWSAFQACGSICVGDSREVTCIQDLGKGLHLEILGGDAEANAKFLAHARTMTPLACKALLTAIEGLEHVAAIEAESHGVVGWHKNGEYMLWNEMEMTPQETLSSITSEWPDV